MDDKRRTLVAGIGALLAAAPALGACLQEGARRPGSPDQRLLNAFPELPGSQGLGRAYLRKFPAEANVATLERLLLRGSAGPGCSANTASCVEAIVAAHRDDCARVDMVTLEGYVLSRSECRLYALNALLS